MNTYELRLPGGNEWLYSLLDEDDKDLQQHWTNVRLGYCINERRPSLSMPEDLEKEETTRLMKYIFDNHKGL